MAYAAMYEMWRTRIEDVPFDVLLDLGHGEDFPLRSHPWFYGVRIPMTKHEKDGLPAPEEDARLDLVENRIREAARARDGMYVGRRTGMGNRDLLLYFPEQPRGLDDRVRASIGSELLFISRPDPEWQGYQQLLPGPKDWRRIEDQKLIDALLETETDADAIHALVHRVETTVTKGAEALERLMGKLELEDITIEGAKPRFVVSGTQHTMIEHEAILKVSYVLDSKASKARGTYLGWEAEPVYGDGLDVELGDADSAFLENLLAAAMAGGKDDP